MNIIISLLVGIIKTIKFIPINIKYSFIISDCKKSLKTNRKRIERTGPFKNFIIYIYYPLYILAGLMATIIMIPINFVLCTKDDYIKQKEWHKKKK